MLAIPAQLWAMRYDGACYPDSAATREGFANCQSFAYAVLRHFGRVIPDFRSSELWDDTIHTFIVEDYAPLDLILFNCARDAFGAHVGVIVGDSRVIHLARHVGVPAVWNLGAFAKNPSYRVLIGAKRTRK